MQTTIDDLESSMVVFFADRLVKQLQRKLHTLERIHILS